MKTSQSRKTSAISVCLFSLLTVVLPQAEPALHLSQVVITPAAGMTPPSFTGMVTGGSPNGTAWLQASVDVGNADPWTNIAETALDNLGTATFTNIADPRPQAATAQRDFFRVVASAALPVPDGFSLIPAGTFTMGRTSGDTDSDAPPVSVYVSAFYMAKYETTKELWDAVRASAVNNGYTDLGVGNGSYASKGANHPVHTVSWWDVVKWCNARSEMEGFVPVYRNADGTVFKTGTTVPTPNWSANGYRLPTEAEWEKAARGGVAGQRFPWGDKISHANANFRNSGSEAYRSGTTGYHPTYATGSLPYTSPVGSFAWNGYGLHDMSGNEREWCWDWYSALTYVNGASDPKGASSGSGSGRVYRGGSWGTYAFYCRAAYRGGGFTPTYTSNSIGFRLARSSVP